MLCLGVETSCDETAIALVEDGRRIRSNLILSQVEKHQKFGGVVPELAARCHLEVISQLTAEGLRQAGVSPQAVDLVAATYGPGLIGGLLVGLSLAKALSLAWQVPFVGVNHVEGHIYANFLAHPELEPPLVCLTVSGGHTQLVYMPEHGVYELLGQTRDDAAGEAFDKVARVLGLGYPGGPPIDRLAQQGQPHLTLVQHDALAGTYNFSFSGLKTAVVNLVHNLKQKGEELPAADIAASFQRQVVTILADRAFRAVDEKKVQTLAVSGGVAANSQLRAFFSAEAKKRGVQFVSPPPVLCTDNAAMIAAGGYFRYLKKGPSSLALAVAPRLKLD
ncbi:MAG TPA: tRNA (adenosine(37)-N6)-threonylcarbamoyltransferase complex transferase subunit TsaD [Firmicutes bacterium]|jgi:N6-L-threonylcarbamoyladenine synthase|nr:tRNA (adenosine(37)-N6)-threonylcarbamoyltransferase complex transferase subunit TsaD [Bacillota bacterium]